MVDLILALFVAGTFALGFWCGGRYRTAREFTRRISERIRSWL